jgi:hypothetical protein
MQLVAAGGEGALGDRHHAGAVDENVQRSFPAVEECAYGGEVRQLESLDVDGGGAGAVADLCGGGFAAATSRAVRVTAAPRRASTRAVSVLMPDEAPVTIARRPERSTPARTSSAVECSSNGVVQRRWRGHVLPPVKCSVNDTERASV